MKKVDEKRKIPMKNYFILIVAFLGFILIVVYLCNWFNVYKDYQKETPVIRGQLSEITQEEMEHYMLENPNTILYLCTAYDDVCRNFETEFSKFLNKNDWKDSITYLNLSDIDQNQFIDKFNAKYRYRVKLTNYYPAFIVFNEDRVIDLLQGKKESKLTMKEVKGFLNMYKIEE